MYSPPCAMRNELVKEIREMEQRDPLSLAPPEAAHFPDQTVGELLDDLRGILAEFDPHLDN